MPKQIDSVEILSIKFLNEDHLIVTVLLNTELMDFEFNRTLYPGMTSKFIDPSRNFLDLARDNSPFQNAMIRLVRRAIAGEQLSFPIVLSFEENEEDKNH